MSMNVRKLADQDLTGKTVVIRVDFNCPVDVSGDGVRLSDTTRIDDHVATTIVPLFEKAQPPRNMILLAHQGRPGNKDCTTLRAHFEYCRTKLEPHRIGTSYVWQDRDDAHVKSLGEEAVAGPAVLEHIRGLGDHAVLLLENVRFSPTEEPETDGSVA